jgi:indole-3-glycerol phosphate synthase
MSENINILDRIIASKISEVEHAKELHPIAGLENSPLFSRRCYSLRKSLINSDSGIISEFKRKSPSLGWIRKDANVVEIASGYNAAGASGISILTDEPFFGGLSEDLITAREVVSIPILRKDFIIDPYQLFEAKAIGADVVLLIAAALTIDKTKALAHEARKLGLEVLLEIHNEEELVYANEYVDLIGVNNRNLKTFEQNIDTSFKLAKLIPEEFVKISESGLSKTETVKALREVGYRGFLMGENFMKQPKPAETLQKFIADLTC